MDHSDTLPPDGIPQDVWDTAGKAMGSPLFRPETVRRRIAHTILLERERCAKIADQREAICADAIAKIDAGELYQGIPTARATENSARLEAAHIASLIRGGQS